MGSLLAFFLLTYAATWACWIPVVAFSNSRPISLTYGLWLLGTFAPSLVALALTARNDGTTGVSALIGRILQWRLAARWYVFAISYMAVIKLIVAIAHRMVIGAWPRFGHEGPVIMLLAILVSTPVQSGEEVGWRGFALPRLAQCMGYGRGALLLGVLWACWHMPQFFILAADTYRQSFPVWSLQVIALSVAMAWLYTKTNGSLLLMMLMHAAVNNTKDIVPSAVSNPAGAFSLHASPVMYLTVAVMWIAATYFLIRMPKQSERLTEPPAARAGTQTCARAHPPQ